MNKDKVWHMMLRSAVLWVIPIGFAILTCSCALFRSSFEQIPARKAFSGSFIDQRSITKLRKSYQSHYLLVSTELQQLESAYKDFPQKRNILRKRIAEHQKYLVEMSNYPFLCPSHNTTRLTYAKKRCVICKGTGKFGNGGKCMTCLGKGIIIQKTVSKTVKCTLCKQYYRGSIQGRTLNENK